MVAYFITALFPKPFLSIWLKPFGHLTGPSRRLANIDEITSMWSHWPAANGCNGWIRFGTSTTLWRTSSHHTKKDPLLKATRVDRCAAYSLGLQRRLGGLGGSKGTSASTKCRRGILGWEDAGEVWNVARWMKSSGKLVELAGSWYRKFGEFKLRVAFETLVFFVQCIRWVLTVGVWNNDSWFVRTESACEILFFDIHFNSAEIRAHSKFLLYISLTFGVTHWKEKC